VELASEQRGDGVDGVGSQVVVEGEAEVVDGTERDIAHGVGVELGEAAERAA
jgi:hypothetical protein